MPVTRAPFLRYYDSVLTRSDLESLRNNGWLSDSVIGFAFNFFEHDSFKEHRKDFEFVSPSVVQLIRLTKSSEDVDSVFESLKLDCKQLVFFPINNHENHTAFGGSHWSLMVYIASHHTLMCFDSLKPVNDLISIDFFRRFQRMFPKTTLQLDLPTPGQENS